LFFKWVARYDSVYGLGGSRRAVEAKYYSALNTLQRLRDVSGH
jgi:hypothetical protein